MEAVFIRVKGVLAVMPGYSGGHTENPAYEEVLSGRTGYAEAIKIDFDPLIIPLREVLSLFFVMHDPTTLNRQVSDIGTQYRSAVYYHDETQEETAKNVIREVAKQGIWGKKIVTELTPLETFYPAEEYHVRYFKKNPDQAYCQFVIKPKVSKLRKKYSEWLSEEELR